jgi:hypothetical protein
MKKSIVSVVSIALNIAMICSASAAYNPTLPSVAECQVSAKEIPDIGGPLTVTLHVVDPTPVNIVVVNIMDKSANSIAFGALQLSSGLATDGYWSKTLSVAPNLRPGIYSVVAQNVSDTSNNSITFYFCPNAVINYGNAAVTPTPTPTPTPTLTPVPVMASSPTPASNPPSSTTSEAFDVLLAKYNQVLSQLGSAQIQLKALNSKLTKICALKPKPKGC